MARIALLGLGRMGRAMAQRLADTGHDLTLWNRTRPASIADLPGAYASTPAEAVAGADVVATMLTDGPALRAVLFGDGGAAAHLGPETVLVDMSTIGPDEVTAIRAELPGRVRFVDAPVQGSTPKARAGDLVILVGGADDDVARVRPALESLGAVRHLGPLGSGAAMKLVVNLVLGAAFVTLGEALRLSDKLGLEQGAALDALSGTAIGSLVARLRGRLTQPDAPTQFSVGLAAKDLRLVLGTTGDDGGATAGAAHAFDDAVRAGLGDADITAMVAFLRG